MAYSAGWLWANPARIAAGDGNVAERKRSRSEADTGRRTGLGFGRCLFWAGKLATVFSPRWAEHGAVGWAVLWALLLAGFWGESE